MHSESVFKIKVVNLILVIDIHFWNFLPASMILRMVGLPATTPYGRLRAYGFPSPKFH